MARPLLTPKRVITTLGDLLRDRGVPVSNRDLVHALLDFAKLHEGQQIPSVKRFTEELKAQMAIFLFHKGFTIYELAAKFQMKEARVRRIVGSDRMRMRRARRASARLEGLKARWL